MQLKLGVGHVLQQLVSVHVPAEQYGELKQVNLWQCSSTLKIDLTITGKLKKGSEKLESYTNSPRVRANFILVERASPDTSALHRLGTSPL